jgi:hypothetical protein
MKPYHEIRQRLIEMNSTPHRNYLKTYGSLRAGGFDGIFNEAFLTGFTKSLRHVLGEKLEDAEILENHQSILNMGKEQDKTLIGERNGYAWCLNFITR